MYKKVKMVVDSFFSPVRVSAAALGGESAASAVKLMTFCFTPLVFILVLPFAVVLHKLGRGSRSENGVSE